MPSIRAVKEVLKAAANCATISYPYGPPAHLPEGFRGRLQIDPEKCIACGACAMVCASGAMQRMEGDAKVGVKVEYPKCIFCGQCRDSCPTQSITLTTEFALTSDRLDELVLQNELEVAKCQICGKPIASKKQLEWGLQNVLNKINPTIKQVIQQDAAKYLNLCIECRRSHSVELKIHTMKYV